MNTGILFSAPDTDGEDSWTLQGEKSFIGFFQLYGHGSQSHLFCLNRLCVYVCKVKGWKKKENHRKMVGCQEKGTPYQSRLNNQAMYFSFSARTVFNMQLMCHSFLPQKVSALVIFRP